MSRICRFQALKLLPMQIQKLVLEVKSWKRKNRREILHFNTSNTLKIFSVQLKAETNIIHEILGNKATLNYSANSRRI